MKKTTRLLHKYPEWSRLLAGWIWIVLNACLAAFCGVVLAFGPADFNPPWIFVSGAVFGLLGGGLWVWALWTEYRPLKLSRQRRLLFAMLFLFLAIILISLIQLNGAGQLFTANHDRVKNFKKLWQVMDAHYPYFDEKQVDWKAIYQRYYPQVQNTQSNQEFYVLVAQMLSELGDAHTGFLNQDLIENRHYFGTALQLDDGVVIDRVGWIARQAGVQRGAQLLEVDGLSVDDAKLALPVLLRAGSTQWQSQSWAATHLLSTPDDHLQISFANPGEQPSSVTLTWTFETPTPAQLTKSAEMPLITWQRLPSGLGLIRIPTFSRISGHDLVAEFDQSLDALVNATGLILDLRGNGGGDSRLADAIAGRFFLERFCYGQDRFTRRLPQHAWRTNFDYCVNPRGYIDLRPVALLIDVRNMSSAEQFITAFVETKRAVTIGRRTGGASGNPLKFELAGGAWIRFSSGAFYSQSENILEGKGIYPDVYVPFTMDDFQRGHDPDLLTAEEIFIR